MDDFESNQQINVTGIEISDQQLASGGQNSAKHEEENDWGVISVNQAGNVNNDTKMSRIKEEETIDDEDMGSEYKRLLDEIGMPPMSLRRNAPLKNHQEKLPKWFSRDEKYEVKDDQMLVPRVGSRRQQKRNVKSPVRGGIRLCRITQERIYPLQESKNAYSQNNPLGQSCLSNNLQF